MKETKQQKKMNIDITLLSRKAGLLLLDTCLVMFSMAFALWVRCDFSFNRIDPIFLEALWFYWPINVLSTLLINASCLLYRSLWRFASVEELSYVVLAGFASGGVQYFGMKMLDIHMPRSYPVLYTAILICVTALSRYSYRYLRILLNNMEQNNQNLRKRTMVVGGGSAGFMIVQEMKHSKHLAKEVCCIIDDDPKKQGTYLQGVPVVGGRDKIVECVDKYRIEEIFITIPSLNREQRKELLNICAGTGCHVMAIPGLYQLVDQEVTVSMLKEVEIEDLLGREPIRLDLQDVAEYIQGKVVLVTGGGGSIGSELCRQIAEYKAATLIIFDIYENNAYDIQNELRRKHPELDLRVLIGSVRNEKRVRSIFETYHPELVFHAAAHKHVPLMEDSPNEAIKNNILGTWNVAKAANDYQARKMVLISTDKAVRPTNIMGASKRVCELIISMYSRKPDSRTEYAAVRFGNVLGSNGSVIPLFRKQIAEGGPVTVTHKDIIRYFMTIPEAVNLVLQCGALAHGGEMFILDMGQPVKIDTLARNMISLSGLTPDVDIKVIYTGLRPGEKLYEELLINEDNLKKTEKDRIFVAQQTPIDAEWLTEHLDALIERAWNEDSDIRSGVHELVPEYTIQS